MKEQYKIPDVVIRRLPRYRRCLEELIASDKDRISSNALSEITGFTASQIRQDLNNFGGFGQQGYGYNVKELHKAIGRILGNTRAYNLIILGGGNLGHAIANYTYLQKEHYFLKAMFDVSASLIGTYVNGTKVLSYSELDGFLDGNKIDIGVICTNKSSAQEVADKLVAGGVKGIWNFAPIEIKVPETVVVENVHLSESLHALTYYINRTE